MNIYLIRSQELSKARFTEIYKLIKKIKGPVIFRAQKEDLIFEDENNDENKNIREIKTWQSLFDVCEEYRRKHNYGENRIKSEDVVVLLTDHQNEHDWFSSWLPGETGNRRNFFVQTSMWESFVEWNDFTLSDSRYTIVYELISIPLYLSLFKTNKELVNAAHLAKMEWGCPLDMCDDKRDVLRKYHSGDVCPQCKNLIKEKGINSFIAKQFFQTISLVRTLFLNRERLWCMRKPSQINLYSAKRELVFQELAGYTIKFAPREWTLYCILLKHPEIDDFEKLKDYEEELFNLYKQQSTNRGHAKILGVVKEIMSDKKIFSELVSRINSAFDDNLDVYLRDFYKIHGNPRNKIKYKIEIDRKLVKFYKYSK